MSPDIQITIEIVTPAYAGGADTATSDGLRPPVLKALLRFWWRTMHPELAPDQLFKRESLLFGSTSGGQGLRVVPTAPWRTLTTDPKDTPERSPAHGYLAYGPVVRDTQKRVNVLKTPRVYPAQIVKFSLWLPRNAYPNAKTEILQALWLLSAFGGFGSRSRRGWGSLDVRPDGGFEPDLPGLKSAADARTVAANMAAGLEIIMGPRTAITPYGGTLPGFTAFSQDSVIAVGDAMPTIKRAVDELFKVYNRFRRLLGAYRPHDPGDVGPDHDLRAGWLRNPPSPGDAAPLGSAFGLPLNAHFTDGPSVDIGVGPDMKGRRASPLLMSVVPCRRGFCPVFLWLRSEFLPPTQHAFAKVGGANATMVTVTDDAVNAFFFGTTAVPLPPGIEWPYLAEPGSGFTEVSW